MNTDKKRTKSKPVPPFANPAKDGAPEKARARQTAGKMPAPQPCAKAVLNPPIRIRLAARQGLTPPGKEG